ncbi:MAG: M10 family metallopeptidase C-terminal domain-containing protein, partial [Paracoccaceae bacterium]
ILAGAAGTAIGITAIAGVEAISANGFANVYLRGTSAAETLNFSAVTLTGLARIDAGAGNDSLTGSTGADMLTGGAGVDLLTGGAGADVFDFNFITESRGATFDTITDFSNGLDLIDLGGIDAQSLVAGNQAFSFIGSAAFGLIAGQLRMITTTPGVTRIQGDVDGNGSADFEVRLAWNGGPAILVDQLDFIL